MRVTVPPGSRFKELSAIGGEESALELLRWSKSIVTRAQSHLEPRKVAGSDAVRLLRRDATVVQALAERVVREYLDACAAAALRLREEDLNALVRIDREVREGVLYSDYAAFMGTSNREADEDAVGGSRA